MIEALLALLVCVIFLLAVAAYVVEDLRRTNKRLNIAEEMIHDLANQYMILLHVRANNQVIELRPEMAIKEKLH